MRTRKGYSLIMWAMTITVAIASLSIFQNILKRGLQGKVWATTDYILWSSIGQEPDILAIEEPETTSYSVTRTESTIRKQRHESHDGTIRYYQDPAVSRGTTRRAMVSVGLGQETMLGLMPPDFDLNEYVD
ncbi:hypothetical protein ACFL38_02000 [Candidatus Omnitrophota bacterium]